MTLEDRVLDLLDRMLPAYLGWVAENQGEPDISLCTKYLTHAIHAGFSFPGERRSAQFAAATLLRNVYAIYPQNHGCRHAQSGDLDGDRCRGHGYSLNRSYGRGRGRRKEDFKCR